MAVHCHKSIDTAEETAAEIRRGDRPWCRPIWGARSKSRADPAGFEGVGAADLSGEQRPRSSRWIRSIRRHGTVGDKHTETNPRAPLVLCRFCAQLPEGTDGNIVNLLDQRVWKLTPYFLLPHCRKDGVVTLTRTLALALAPRIRVNGIGPGPTPAEPAAVGGAVQAQSAAMPLVMARRWAKSPQASSTSLSSPSMTGQMIALDGGEHPAGRCRARVPAARVSKRGIGSGNRTAIGFRLYCSATSRAPECGPPLRPRVRRSHGFGGP